MYYVALHVYEGTFEGSSYEGTKVASYNAVYRLYTCTKVLSYESTFVLSYESTKVLSYESIIYLRRYFRTFEYVPSQLASSR